MTLGAVEVTVLALFVLSPIPHSSRTSTAFRAHEVLGLFLNVPTLCTCRTPVFLPLAIVSRVTRRDQNVSAELGNFDCEDLECFATLDRMEKIHPVLTDDSGDLLLQNAVAFWEAVVSFKDCTREAIASPIVFRSPFEFGCGQSLEVLKIILFGSDVDVQVQFQRTLVVLRSDIVVFIEPVQHGFNDLRIIFFERDRSFFTLLFIRQRGSMNRK